MTPRLGLVLLVSTLLITVSLYQRDAKRCDELERMWVRIRHIERWQNRAIEVFSVMKIDTLRQCPPHRICFDENESVIPCTDADLMCEAKVFALERILSYD